jgi:glycerol-3-phosphate acyltransferase PlsX
MVTVAVDAGGADLGPREVARGAALATQQGIRVLLFGPAQDIGEVGDGVEVVDAPVSIAKATDPAFAVRTTPEASIVQAAKAVADGQAQALVSGGSTGSALAAALFNLRRDRGIYRPALALPLPIPGSTPVLLLDVGANVTCRPEHMIQFAHMGSAFAQAVMGIPEPRVALLSNGEEPGKGTPDLVSVHEQLAGPAGVGLRFVGNIEGTQLPEGVTDVLVMDGFTGNVTLKLTEGVSLATLRAVRTAAMSSWRGRLGGLLLSSGVRRLREHIDPEAQGGAYMLGLRHVGVVAHGRFSHRGFARAIEVAARGVQEDVIGRTRAVLSAAGALRPSPVPTAQSPESATTNDDSPGSETPTPESREPGTSPSGPSEPTSEAAATVSKE